MDQDAQSQPSYVAFAGPSRVACGALSQVALAARRSQDRNPRLQVLVFNRTSGRVVDIDLRGSENDIVSRLATTAEPARRGRPKLGVVAREVTLLPRHWDWLATQPGGASVALRRLVEMARKADAGQGEMRLRTEAAYRFMSAMAGDLAGFEEASRALFAGDRRRLEEAVSTWPADVGEEVLALAGGGAG